MNWPTIINRVLSVVVAMALLGGVLSLKARDEDSSSCIVGVLFGLCLIWFGDALGSFTGYIGRGGNIDTETPGWLVATFGWFFLIGVPLVIVLTSPMPVC